MSVTVAVDTVVGVMFPKEKLFYDKKVKTFNHDYPDTMKFCSDTGKALWKIDKHCPLFPGLEYGDDRFAGLKLVNGPSVHEQNKNGNWESEYKTFYVGKSFGTNAYEDNKRVSYISEKAVADIKTEVQAKLEPLGLWDEKNFGIWTVLYVG